MGDSPVSQAYPRKELGGYRDEASGHDVLLKLQRSPRTERQQVVVRKMGPMISNLRRAEGLWLQNEVQFSESCRFWGSPRHDDACDLQVRILGWRRPLISVNIRATCLGHAGPSLALVGVIFHSLYLLYTPAPKPGF